MENNGEECFPNVTNKAVLRGEKWDKGTNEFKTRENSASPNEDLKERGTTPTERGTTPTECGTTPTGDLNKVAMKLS